MWHFDGIIAFDYASYRAPQGSADTSHRSRGVQDVKTILLGHAVKDFQHLCLVFNKAVVKILTEVNVHARFPIVKPSARREYTLDEFLSCIDPKIKNSVRNQSNLIDRAYPGRINPSHLGARNCRVDVSIREHDKPGPQGRQDFILEAIDEVCSIEQLECQATEGVTGLGFFDSAPGKD